MVRSSKRSREARIEDFGSDSEDEIYMDTEKLNGGEGEEEEEEDETDDEVSDYDDEGDNDNEDDNDEEEDNDMENLARKDEEIEELEKEYMELRHNEQNLLKNLKSHKDEDLLKGQAVKNQKGLWDKALEFRLLLQKSYTSSNRLPQEPVKSSFCVDDGVSVAYSDLILSSEMTLDSLLELQQALVEKNPSIAEGPDGNNGKPSKDSESKNLNMEDDEKWLQIFQMQSRIAPFRNKAIDKWQRKTEVTTGAAVIKGKLQAFNQNISEQVSAYMRDPTRMVKQMQMRRATVSVFGSVLKGQDPEATGNSNEEADDDPELLDDSEFYQQLLNEFFETVDPTATDTALYSSLKRQPTKKRKIVDRRASKSRKIRYNIHEKIVSFMAPQRMDIPPTAPKLFENLFGLKTKNTTTVS